MTVSIVKSLLPVLVVLLCVLIATLVLRALLRKQGGEESWPFVSKFPLSHIEQVLYYRLVQALPEHIVLAQVQISRFLTVRKGTTDTGWNNRIDKKSIDFLICNRDFSIVAAIELDDSTHARARSIKRDDVKNRALAAADVALIRWRASALPDEEEIRRAIDGVVGDGSLPDVKSLPRRVEPSLHITRIDAINDPEMFTEETQP